MTDAHPFPAFGLVIEDNQLAISRAQRPGFFDPRFLVAALLDHVARADGAVCDAEAVAMVELIATRFGLDSQQAEARLGHVLNLYSQSMDLASVGELLCEVLCGDERIDVMSMLLEVAAADGHRRSDELAAVDQAASALNLSDEERHAGFQRYFDARDEGLSLIHN